MAKPNMKPEFWEAIRLAYEYDPDQPSMEISAERAGSKLNFKPPTRQTISYKITKDKENGNPWVRHGTMHGIAAAAQIRADSLTISNDSDTSDVISLKNEQTSRDEAIDLRAEINARHRHEWAIAIALRNEALKDRRVDHKKSFELAKLAKITHEMLLLQQSGERKAWCLDEINIDFTKLTDEQLQDIINGKMPR
jgi:hypothetical protein